uniref:S16 family serine protease n=1 Tax=Euzebya sp. TaxID=1971409 RepID=UPI003514AE47
LAGGRVITGTGTVDADGRVGTVGSVADKVLGAEAAGADVVLVPEAHADEARRAATTIEVIAVGSVADAVEALAAPASSG